jgi:ATP adenylyltransferase
MQRLWTPWRRAFIEGAAAVRDDSCFLCTLPVETDDRTNLILLRNEHAFVVLNRYPYNSGHLMVAPYVHTGDFAALDGAVAAEMMHTTQAAVAALEEEYRPDAFNLGMNLGKSAGAGVPDHLHIHVVPRWNGDTNFMPLVGDTKVLPETLDQTYARLEPHFRGMLRGYAV